MTRLFKSLGLGLVAVFGAGLVQTASANTPFPLKAKGVGQLLQQFDPTPRIRLASISM